MPGRGRPTLYKPENGELARKFCMLGATNEELAGCFEVARSTIDEWLASIPEFAEGVRQDCAIAGPTTGSRKQSLRERKRRSSTWRGCWTPPVSRCAS
jgi:hypothetical protein